MTKSYIFRQDFRNDRRLNECDGIEVLLVDRPIVALRRWRPLSAHFGWPDYLKHLAKTATGKRALYLAIEDGCVIARGALSMGFCRHYAVEADSVVIGSVWTDARRRGQGLATRSLRSVIRLLSGGAKSVFYIDTQETNAPMLRAIEKLGFGAPVGVFRH